MSIILYKISDNQQSQTKRVDVIKNCCIEYSNTDVRYVSWDIDDLIVGKMKLTDWSNL